MPYKDKQKQKDAQRKHYRENKEVYARRQKEKYEKNKAFIVQCKTNKKCSMCSESHPVCLEFHHIGEQKKEMKIADAIYKLGLKRLKEEVAKCILLCANCHRKFHYNEMKDRGIKLLYERILSP
jgi:hypothetical protein